MANRYLEAFKVINYIASRYNKNPESSFYGQNKLSEPIKVMTQAYQKHNKDLKLTDEMLTYSTTKWGKVPYGSKDLDFKAYITLCDGSIARPFLPGFIIRDDEHEELITLITIPSPELTKKIMNLEQPDVTSLMTDFVINIRELAASLIKVFSGRALNIKNFKWELDDEMIRFAAGVFTLIFAIRVFGEDKVKENLTASFSKRMWDEVDTINLRSLALGTDVIEQWIDKQFYKFDFYTDEIDEEE